MKIILGHVAAVGAVCFLGCSVDTFIGQDAGPAPDAAALDAGALDALGEEVNFDADSDVADATTVEAEAGLAYKRVFITSTHFASNFGSLAAADSACGSAASDAGLGGSWKAWLSTSSVSAASRLTHASVPYQLVDGTQVALNWNALVSGPPLQNAIYADEQGNFVPYNSNQSSGLAWTGTSSDGSIVSNATCSDWTVTQDCSASTVYKGAVGRDDQVSSSWTSWSVTACCTTQNFSLYCFEQ